MSTEDKLDPLGYCDSHGHGDDDSTVTVIDNMQLGESATSGGSVSSVSSSVQRQRECELALAKLEEEERIKDAELERQRFEIEQKIKARKVEKKVRFAELKLEIAINGSSENGSVKSSRSETKAKAPLPRTSTPAQQLRQNPRAGDPASILRAESALKGDPMANLDSGIATNPFLNASSPPFVSRLSHAQAPSLAAVNAAHLPASTTPAHPAAAVTRDRPPTVTPVHPADAGMGDPSPPARLVATAADMSYLPEALQASLHHQQLLTEAVLEQQRRSTLPPSAVPKFSGDVKQFRVFLDSFNSVVMSKTEDYRDRLHYLNQYLGIEQQRLIAGCILMQDSKYGFELAMSILTKRYGCKYKLERAYVDQLTEITNVKLGDANSLRELSVVLNECLYATRALELSGQVEREIPRLISKLPNHLQISWHKKHFETLDRTGGPPKFHEFVEFIDLKADIAAALDETKRLHESSSGSKSKEDKTPKSMTTLMTVDKPDEASVGTKDRGICIFCRKGYHPLIKCFAFQKVSPAQRKRFARERKLCFKCLTEDHFSDECDEESACDHCSEPHNSLLHIFTPTSRVESPPRGEKPSAPDGASEEAGAGVETGRGADVAEVAVSMMASGPGRKVGLPIIPLRVNVNGSGREDTAYAALDICSNASYIRKSLVNRLSAVPCKAPRDLHLNTMAGSEEMSRPDVVHGLTVRGMTGEGELTLKGMIVRDSIPASTDDMIIDHDLKKWPYLKEVKLEPPSRIYRKVDLLIGGNNPSAHHILKMILSEKEGPNAALTTFGSWTVYGPTSKQDIFGE